MYIHSEKKLLIKSFVENKYLNKEHCGHKDASKASQVSLSICMCGQIVVIAIL